MAAKGKKHEEFKPYKVELLIQTPYIAPALSPLKFVKKRQIEFIAECYRKQGVSDDDIETLKHLDRAFERDAECNAFIPGTVLSGALMNAPGNNSVIIKGQINIPKEVIAINAKQVTLGGSQTSVMIYEYLPSGTKLSGVVSINAEIPKLLTVVLGAYRSKGYGKALLTFTPQ